MFWRDDEKIQPIGVTGSQKLIRKTKKNKNNLIEKFLGRLLGYHINCIWYWLWESTRTSTRTPLGVPPHPPKEFVKSTEGKV